MVPVRGAGGAEAGPRSRESWLIVGPPAGAGGGIAGPRSWESCVTAGPPLGAGAGWWVGPDGRDGVTAAGLDTGLGAGGCVAVGWS